MGSKLNLENLWIKSHSEKMSSIYSNRLSNRLRLEPSTDNVYKKWVPRVSKDNYLKKTCKFILLALLQAEKNCKKN